MDEQGQPYSGINVERRIRRDMAEMLGLCKGVLADGVVVEGETATTGLPLDQPQPSLEIPNRTFVFTGRFAYGTRRACEEAVRQLAGWAESGMTKRTDYLIIGTFASRDWVQTSYGTKILKAVEYREKYSAPAIVSEQHWVAHL